MEGGTCVRTTIEDDKGVISSRKWKVRQCNGQRTKTKYDKSNYQYNLMT